MIAITKPRRGDIIIARNNLNPTEPRRGDIIEFTVIQHMFVEENSPRARDGGTCLPPGGFV